MKLKFLALFIVLFSFENNYAQYTDVINSNRPGSSMSAYSVGKTIIQIESGLNYIKEDHNELDYTAKGYVFDLVGRYGFFKEELEVIGEIKYQGDKYVSETENTSRNGLRVANLGFKYLFYDPYKNYEDKPNIYSWKANHSFKWHQFIPAISGYVGANYNPSKNPFIPNYQETSPVSPKAMLITQNVFTGAWVFITNIYYDKITTDYKTLGYVITLTKGFNDHWSGFIENKWSKNDFSSDGFFTVGAAYLINKNIQVDASITTNIKDTPSYTYGGIGFSWRNDKNYKPVIIKDGKTEKKDKSIKGKNKEKAKKRLDEVQLENP